MKVINGSEQTVIQPGQSVRVVIRQDALESGVNPRLVFLIDTWRELIQSWLNQLPAKQGITIQGEPAWAGTPLPLFNGSVAVDLRSASQMTALALMNRLNDSLPLGADVETLDVARSGTLTEQANRSSDFFPDPTGASSGVAKVTSALTFVAIAGSLFFLVQLVRDAKGGK